MMIWKHKKLSIIFLVLLLLGVAGVYFFVQETSRVEAPTVDLSQNESQDNSDTPVLGELAANLRIPWSLAFLPNGDLLVTTRPGIVRLVTAGGGVQSEPLLIINDVHHSGEGGLLGIAVHPDFEQNGFVYFYYTYEGDGENTLNRVVRYTMDGQNVLDRTVVVDEIPGAGNHNGGRIKFGPDGFLYIGTGDAARPSLAQDRNSLAGKILRVTGDGSAAPGNPFGNRVYSYGHRNVQGLAWDNQGRLWATEHGSSATDELNLIAAGENYGWPIIRGDETNPDMQTPKRHSGSTTWAPSGAAFLNGSVFFGGLRGQTLFEAVIQGDRVVGLKEHFAGELGRIRAVVVGPDRFLYITTNNTDGRGIPKQADDKIFRVNPDKL